MNWYPSQECIDCGYSTAAPRRNDALRFRHCLGQLVDVALRPAAFAAGRFALLISSSVGTSAAACQPNEWRQSIAAMLKTAGFDIVDIKNELRATEMRVVPRSAARRPDGLKQNDNLSLEQDLSKFMREHTLMRSGFSVNRKVPLSEYFAAKFLLSSYFSGVTHSFGKNLVVKDAK